MGRQDDMVDKRRGPEVRQKPGEAVDGHATPQVVAGPVEMPTSAAELRIMLTPASKIRAPLLDTARSGGGHVFISYVTEDSMRVDRLQRDLEKSGITVWRDRSSLGPGDLWKTSIRRAIGSGTFFLACFSAASRKRAKSYMNEELTLAIEELRMRNRDRVWFLPVLFPGGEVPDRPIGGGETLRDFNYIALAPKTWSSGVRQLVQVINKN
jgi:TIR domain